MSIDDLARRRMALLEQREAIEAEIKSVDAQLIDAIEVGGHIDLDGAAVFRVQQKRDFRVDLAEKVLPAEVIAAATTTVEQVDRARLKAYAEAMGVIDDCLKVSTPFVSAVRR